MGQCGVRASLWMFISPRIVHIGYFALMASTPTALRGGQGEGVLAQASVQGMIHIAMKLIQALPRK